MYYSLILDLFLQLQLKDMAVEIVYFVYFLETALSSQFQQQQLEDLAIENLQLQFEDLV